MIHLIEVTEENWLEMAALRVSEEQKNFLAPAIGILARGYVDEDLPECLNLIYHFEKTGAF